LPDSEREFVYGNPEVVPRGDLAAFGPRPRQECGLPARGY
jgi:hypothetical protein